MAKRPSLAESMKAVAREPIEESVPSAPAMPAPASVVAPVPDQPVEDTVAGSGYRAKTREGMKRLTVVVPPEDHRRIKRLSVDADRSIEDLMREALADLLKRHNA